MKNLYIVLITTTILFGCSTGQHEFKPSNRNTRPDTSSFSKYNIKATTEEMTHEYVIDYPGITKDEIFERAIKWIALNFKSAKQVIDYQDKSAGSIIAKGILPEVSLEGRYVDISFTLSIDVKENKARYVFTNVSALYNNKELKDLDGKQQLHLGATAEFTKVVDLISKDVLKKDDF